MNLKELIAKQARADGRAMSEEEERTFNELQTEIDKLKIEEATKIIAIRVCMKNRFI